MLTMTTTLTNFPVGPSLVEFRHRFLAVPIPAVFRRHFPVVATSSLVEPLGADSHRPVDGPAQLQRERALGLILSENRNH